MKNDNATSGEASPEKQAQRGALGVASGSALWDADWQDSCDNCLYQEGRHYCIFHAQQVKNMDTVRCGSWQSKSE